MKYQSFLIKYAEIGTKGKNRYLFEDALIRQIKIALKRVDGKFLASKESGRIYVQALEDYDYDEVIEALQHVFGIAWICPVLQIEDKDYENLKLAYGFNRRIGLPVCLGDLELAREDKLEDVLAVTMANQELVHTPYEVTGEMIYRAIQELEEYRG